MEYQFGSHLFVTLPKLCSSSPSGFLKATLSPDFPAYVPMTTRARRSVREKRSCECPISARDLNSLYTHTALNVGGLRRLGLFCLKKLMFYDPRESSTHTCAHHTRIIPHPERLRGVAESILGFASRVGLNSPRGHRRLRHSLPGSARLRGRAPWRYPLRCRVGCSARTGLQGCALRNFWSALLGIVTLVAREAHHADDGMRKVSQLRNAHLRAVDQRVAQEDLM